jgi:glycosyltransferase involved in cell wall biosynthesis
LANVSIIIPFYNCPYIDQAIESALNQTYKNIEVIVVNDGSTLHQEKIQPYLNKIQYIEKSNGGTASALNAGIRIATGKYFSWLSSDDIYLPQKIEQQLNFMKVNQLSASYTNFCTINEKGAILSTSQGVHLSTRIDFVKKMRRGCIVNGCTVMLEMSVFQELGLFDESLKYTQDYDFWLRVLTKHHFHYFSESLVNYRIHSNMGTRKYRVAIRKEILETIKRHKHKLDLLIQQLNHQI